MKKISKILSILLVCVCLGSALFGCSGSSGGTNIDTGKSQLYVGSYNGGYGTKWLEDIAKDFENDPIISSTSFEKGKTGVQVIIDPKENFLGQTLAENIAGDKNNIIFAEQVYYDEMVKQNLLLDITDVMTTEPSTGDGILENKLLDWQKEVLKTSDGKYYAIPHYQIFNGMIYDKDLFDEYGLYIPLYPDTDANEYGFLDDPSYEKSYGPDGKPKTEDDGLPATYDELKKLINYMASGTDITPFIWTGKSKGYLHKIVASASAAYNGNEGILVQATFNSNGKEMDVVTGFESNGQPVIKKQAITPETGYLARQLYGTYLGFELCEYILSNESFYTSSSKGDTSSQTAAQREYIYSAYETGQNPIAFLLDGCYWENEATNAFKSFEDKFDANHTFERNFRMLPMPGAEGVETGMLDTAFSYVVANRNISNDPEKVNLVKTFLKYCYTNEALEKFTVSTGSTRALKYEISDGAYKSLSSYQQSVWNQRKAMDWSATVSTSKIYLNAQSKLSLTANSDYYESVIAGKGTYSSVYDAIKNNGLKAKDYFKGMWISPEDWNSTYYKV